MNQVTDSVMRTMAECRLSAPNWQLKSNIWDQLTSPKYALAMSLYDYKMLCRVFLQPYITYHFDLAMLHAADQFYEVLPNLVKQLDRSRAESFMAGACPAIRAAPEDN